MMSGLGTRTSCHLQIADREAVERALAELAGTGPSLPAWPPRRLPPGLFLSPVRYDWVSLWGTEQGWEQHLAGLTATLECAGVEFRLLGDDSGIFQVHAAEYRPPEAG